MPQLFAVFLDYQQSREPIVHIAPAPLFHLFSIQITNSILYGWFCLMVALGLLFFAARLTRLKSGRGIVGLVELGADFIFKQIESAFQSREKAVRYSPYFVTLFFFILINNWLGLLPGVGEALTLHDQPLLRPFTADLNGTLAAAAVTMAFVIILTLREVGLNKSIKHYFHGSLFNPLTWLMAFLELLTDSTRVFSLALRLFLNVAVGEIIIAVFSFLGKSFAPLTALPFFILELLVGALQAYIFVILAVMYIAVTVRESETEQLEATAPPQA